MREVSAAAKTMVSVISNKWQKICNIPIPDSLHRKSLPR
jgi:hypothetical protein